IDPWAEEYVVQPEIHTCGPAIFDGLIAGAGRPGIATGVDCQFAVIRVRVTRAAIDLPVLDVRLDKHSPDLVGRAAAEAANRVAIGIGRYHHFIIVLRIHEYGKRGLLEVTETRGF